MIDASAAADVFRQAAALNREDPLRDGSQLIFPDYGQLVMTGDLHGHDRNFERLKKYCDLESTPVRHVMLHEIIHAEPDAPLMPDYSHKVLLDAARWKIEFPDQIHFLQSNHELSQLTGKEICKGGRIVTYDFERGLAETYGYDHKRVLEAICEFISSLPLAGRTSNRVMLTHSLPSNRDLPSFDPSVFDRIPEPADLHEGGSAYTLVWGRNQSAEVLSSLADTFDVGTFICGHQPQEFGFEVRHDKLIILASDHNHGVFLPFDLKKAYTTADLAKLIRPIASIA